MVSFVLKELKAKGVCQIIDIADIADIADISIGSFATSALAALKIFVRGHPDQNNTSFDPRTQINQLINPFHQ